MHRHIPNPLTVRPLPLEKRPDLTPGSLADIKQVSENKTVRGQILPRLRDLWATLHGLLDDGRIRLFDG